MNGEVDRGKSRENRLVAGQRRGRLPHSPISLAVSSFFLALYPVYRLFSARPYSQWNFPLLNKLSSHATQSQLSVLSRYFYVTLNLVAVKTV